MKRNVLEDLVKWKEKENRKPLLIRGARQVGKTWIMKEFGRLYYEKTVYINFDKHPQLETLFHDTLDVTVIISGLQILAGHVIDPKHTLIIFDEIQEVPKALTSLKYFNEDAPEYQIICAGSLLGVAMHQGTSFPVGKVEFLDLYPLSFDEFLCALGKEMLVETLKKREYALANSFESEYQTLLKQYYYIGGMPEVVQTFSERHDFHEVRDIQERILLAYEQDFSKHAPNSIIPRIRSIWNSVPSQLVKENKKFIYGLIKEGARVKDYELALMWLHDCGLIHKVSRIHTPKLPLSAYEDLKAFKLFILDVGLLSCMVNLSQEVLLSGNALFVEFKGALSEQYVLQQLVTNKHLSTFYWSNPKGIAELDFIISDGNRVIPIEVKAETNVKAKSLKAYRDMFQPEHSVRISLKKYKKEDGLLNLPLWAVMMLEKEIQL